MGKFDKMEQRNADAFATVERVGEANSHDRLPLADSADMHGVMDELDTVTPDMLLNRCKQEADGEKHVLRLFYTTRDGKGVWRDVAMPKYRARQYGNRGYFEAVDCRTGRRKTFIRKSLRAVKKVMDANGRWLVSALKSVDHARFK